MRRGKVIFFDFSLGYGFITDSETCEDIFVKKRSLFYRQLNPDDEVEYDIKKDTDGLVAYNVRKILIKEELL
jgi:cold shock protein